MQSSILNVITITVVAAITFILIRGSGFNSDPDFQAFKVKFQKQYIDAFEETYRQAVYNQHIQYILAFNQINGNRLGETQFLDLTKEEFMHKYLIPNFNSSSLNDANIIEKQVSDSQLLRSVDWVAFGAVTQVKMQNSLESSSYFTQVGLLEGHFYILGSPLVELAAQQLIDCVDESTSKNPDPKKILDYVKKNGITIDALYPHSGTRSSCKIKGGPYKINSFTKIDTTEVALVQALQLQPVSVMVDATNFIYYNPTIRRVFSDCSQIINHPILAVGYDDESFKLKNSWGTMWGEDGYIFIKRGDNTCGIQNYGIIIES